MIRTLLNALVAFLAFSALGWGAEQTPQGTTRREPDHLVPVDPYPSAVHDAYIKRCYKLLEVAEAESFELFQHSKRETVIMVRRPAFAGEACIALREETDTGKHNLIYTSATHNIWFSMSEGRGKEKSDGVKVLKVSRPLDPARAKRIYDLWERMLNGVRYPQGGPRSGCPDDGQTFEFRYASRGMYGETCSPTKGPPRLFVALGNSLITYCTTSDDELRMALSVIDTRCKELEYALKTNHTTNEGHDASRKK